MQLEIRLECGQSGRECQKHGVTFEEACSVFLDALSNTGADRDHSLGEARWLTFGMSAAGRTLVVSHTDQRDTIRIISAVLRGCRTKAL